MRGLGFIKDRSDVNYPTHRRLGSRDKLIEVPSMTPFRDGRVYQGGLQCCVASSLKRAVQLWHGARGIAAPMVSDLFAYYVGRAQEYAGQDPDNAPMVADVGSIPELVMLGTQRVGLVTESTFPGAASYWSDPPAERVNREPSPDIISTAYDARGLQFHAVDTSYGLRSAVSDCLIRGCPVILAVNANGLVAKDPGSEVVRVMQGRSNHNKATCALANKLARICYATLRDHEPYGAARLNKKIARAAFALPA